MWAQESPEEEIEEIEFEEMDIPEEKALVNLNENVKTIIFWTRIKHSAFCLSG